MLLLFILSLLIPLSFQHCLISSNKDHKVSNEAHQSLLQSELKFSTDLIHTVASLQPDANVLISPSSVFQASLLAYFISANHTEQSLRQTLHLSDKQDKLDILGAYNLEHYYQKLRSIKSRNYLLSNLNRMYVAKDLKIPYCMKVLFAEEIHQANFQENAGGVVNKINQWVAGLTRGFIKDFLPSDAISEDSKLALVNAAYFKGKWKSPFNEDDSYEGMFHLNNGSEVKVTFMTQDGKFRNRIDKKLGADVLEFPYAGDDISIFVLLPVKPSASAVQEMLKKLDSKTLQNLVQVMATKGSLGPKISTTIPKFTFESSSEITSILEEMGIGDIFQKTADLSTLAPGLSFSEAVHKAKIQVDEKGTEAAAATSFITARQYTESYIANRPFAYIIYDKINNIPLFFGIFNSP